MKDPASLQQGGVFNDLCLCCKIYLGETKRSIKTRIIEHYRVTKKKNISASSLAVHSHNKGRSIQFDQTKAWPYFTIVNKYQRSEELVSYEI